MEENETLPKVASNFLSDCKKCGEERYHVVLAHPTKTSAKLECEVCGSKKTYRVGAKGKKSTKSASTKSASTKRAESKAEKALNQHIEMWEKLKEELGAGKPARYNMASVFEIQTAIEHPKFGLGFVTEVAANKIGVLFRDTSKFLVHNRTP